MLDDVGQPGLGELHRLLWFAHNGHARDRPVKVPWNIDVGPTEAPASGTYARAAVHDSATRAEPAGRRMRLMDMRLHRWLTLALFSLCVAACSGSAQHAASPSPSRSTPAASPSSPPVLPVTPASTAHETTPTNRSPSAPAVDSAITVYAVCTVPAAQQHPTVEPPTIEMACADDGFGIQNLHWTRWTADSATGAGTIWYKDCRPNCAEGKIIYTPGVQVTLTHPETGASGGLVWSQIAFSTVPPGYPAGPQALRTHPI